MTGHQLQRRPGYEIDVEKVLLACARNDVAAEINAHAWRLDLDWRWHQAALDFGCMIASIRTRTRSVNSTTLGHRNSRKGASRRTVS